MKEQPKIGKILFTLSNYRFASNYHTWHFPLKRLSKELIFFDTHWNKILYGKKEMNRRFLNVIQKEKPDYIHMSFGPDEFELDTLLNVKKMSPNTKIIASFGDDDLEFERYSRYIMLFVDYGIIHQKRYLDKYKKEGINNVAELVAVDTNFFKPLKLPKKYDVTFFGLPLSGKSDRYNIINFLKEKKININLFGWGWEGYSNLKEIYNGPLSSEELVRVINQSKINLCLSKNADGKTHLKNRVIEAGGCKTFVLVEYCKEYLDFFKEGKEIIMFKNKKDLLQKIDYYLKNEKEREKLANVMYQKIKKEYDMETKLKRIFDKISENPPKSQKLPKLDKKIFSFDESLFNKNKSEISKILDKYDYIDFIQRDCKELKYKKFLQAYSLMKTKKPISFCDYYVHKKNLGDYLYFQTEIAFKELKKEDFISFLNPSQIMVTRNFFLDNFEKFKQVYDKKIDFLEKKNTVFVGLPLLRIKSVSIRKYEIMKKAFIFKFLHEIYSYYHTKKIFYKPYVLALLLEILSGKHFILRHLINSIKDKNRTNRLKIYKKHSKYF